MTEEEDLLDKNRRFLKKIISTLADKDMMVREGINGGDMRDNLRRSTRLVEREEKSNGGDVQKGGDERDGDRR